MNRYKILYILGNTGNGKFENLSEVMESESMPMFEEVKNHLEKKYPNGIIGINTWFETKDK